MGNPEAGHLDIASRVVDLNLCNFGVSANLCAGCGRRFRERLRQRAHTAFYE